MLNMISPIVGSLFKTVDKVIDNKAEGEKITVSYTHLTLPTTLNG